MGSDTTTATTATTAIKPTIVFSPGAWITPDIFDGVRALLRDAGYESEAVAHPSIGTEPPTKNLYDDAENLRATLEKLASTGKDIVLITHSYGGCVGSCAVNGLGSAQRTKAGKTGGVIMLVYMSAFVVPKGRSLKDMLGGVFLPWMKFDGDYCRAGPESTKFYFDVSDEQKAYWGPRQTHTSAAVFSTAVNYEPWHDMPTMYFFCDGDLGLPVPVQEQMAQLLGPDVTTFRAASSHFPFLSVPDKVVEGAILAAKIGLEKKAAVL